MLISGEELVRRQVQDKYAATEDNLNKLVIIVNSVSAGIL